MNKANANEREDYQQISRKLNNARKSIKLLLGRDPLSAHEVKEYSKHQISNLLTRILNGEEFYQEIWLPVMITGLATSGRYYGEPSNQMLEWIKEEIPLDGHTKKCLVQKPTWRSVLSAIWHDGQFLSWIQNFENSCESIKRFQKGLKGSTTERMSGATSVFNRSTVQIPGCKLLSADRLDREQLAEAQSVDLTISSVETHNLTKIIAYAAKDDPQIIVPAGMTGHFMLEIGISFAHIVAGKAENYIQIFLDFGDGYKESASYVFPIRDNKVSETLLFNSERKLLNLRIDPCVWASTFVIERLELTKL